MSTSTDSWRRWEETGREPVRAPLSKAAVTSLVFGIVGGVLFAFVFGIVGLVATGKRGTRRGRGLAWAGIALGVVWSLALAALVVWLVERAPDRGADGRVAGAGSAAVSDLQRGDCLDSPGDGGDVAEVRVVPCADSHDAEVVALVTLSSGDGSYDAARVQSESQQLCQSAATEAVPTATSLSLIAYFPQQDSWENDQDRTAVCIVTSPTPVTGSVTGG